MGGATVLWIQGIVARGLSRRPAPGELAPDARMSWYWLADVGRQCPLCPLTRVRLGQLGGNAVDVERACRAVDDVVVGGSLDAGRAGDHLEVSQAGDGVAPGGVPGAGHLLEVGTLVAVMGDAGEVHDRATPRVPSCGF